MTKKSANIPALESIYRPIAGEIDEFELRLVECLKAPSGFVGDLVTHATRSAGKRFRPALLFLAARAAGEVNDAHIRYALAVEAIHTATLLHDDVLDEASLRRSKPTMNVMWGNEPSVLFGDYLFASAFRFASSVDNKRALDIVSRAAVRICEGELMQIEERGNLQLTEEEYLDMVARKTATLCECACRLGALLAGASAKLEDSLAEYGREVGVAFQIVDDCLDLIGDEEEMGKSLGTDLRKDKYTLPLIYLFRTVDGAVDLVRRDLSEPAVWEHLRRELIDTGAVDYAFSVARDHIDRAKSSLASIISPQIRTSLGLLADYVVLRTR